MAYVIQVARPAVRQFRSLPRTVQKRVRPHISTLAENPRAPGSRKLVGENDYRIRVGDYRAANRTSAKLATWPTIVSKLERL